MYTLANCLKDAYFRLHLPRRNVSSSVEGFKGYLRIRPPDETGRAQDFINTLQELYQGENDSALELEALIKFYCFFRENINCLSKCLKIKNLAAFLSEYLGEPIMKALFREQIADAIRDGKNAHEALMRIDENLLRSIIEDAQLCKAVLEDPVPLEEGVTVSKEFIEEDSIRHFFRKCDKITENQLILLINYFKCLVGLPPFQLWNEQCRIRGMAVNAACVLLKISIKLVPRLGPSGNIYIDPIHMLVDAKLAYERALEMLERYFSKIKIEWIKSCDVVITLRPDAVDNMKDVTGLSGASIRLFLTIALLMQFTGMTTQANQNVLVVITGGLNHNNQIEGVGEVVRKTMTALDELNRRNTDLLLMVTPEENFAEAGKAIEQWRQRNPSIEVISPGATPKSNPSIELLFGGDLDTLLLEGIILDFRSTFLHSGDADLVKKLFILTHGINYELNPGGITFPEKVIEVWKERRNNPVFTIIDKPSPLPETKVTEKPKIKEPGLLSRLRLSLRLGKVLRSLTKPKLLIPTSVVVVILLIYLLLPVAPTLDVIVDEIKNPPYEFKIKPSESKKINVEVSKKPLWPFRYGKLKVGIYPPQIGQMTIDSDELKEQYETRIPPVPSITYTAPKEVDKDVIVKVFLEVFDGRGRGMTRSVWFLISKATLSTNVGGDVLAIPKASPKSSDTMKMISFSNYEWKVKSSQGQVGPGPNYFSDSSDNVWVDAQGRLHLRITRRNDRWYCAEVISQRSFGYGIYRFYLESTVDNLGPYIVLGLFTWSDEPAYNHREIDIEWAKWGNANDTTNAQFVVQPYNAPGHLLRFQVPPGTNTTHSFTWKQDSVFFQSIKGHNATTPSPDDVIKQWICNKGIPKAGGENARMNLWLIGGRTPKDGKEAEIIIQKFEFLP
ncbi:glycoside hydrolase family 16 protein [Candidatus Poribacteria bacterium]|nr:glycoside hydrolase family 16 protein [Candidatus Poribacteria bacterium]